MYLDGDMHEIIVVREEALVVLRALRPVGDEDDNGGEVTWPDPPDVQVGHAIVCIRLEHLLDVFSSLFGKLGVQQNPARVAQ